MMSRLLLLLFLLLSPAAHAQPQWLRTHRQQKFPRQVPAGNYSGITWIGDSLYAVVSDKSVEEGFFLLNIQVDGRSGKIRSIRNLSFRSCGRENRDTEGIAYCQSSKTLFICNEKDNEVLEYTLEGMATGRYLPVPAILKSTEPNYGIEALSYNAQTHRFWITAEHASILQSFSDDLQQMEQVPYHLDEPVYRNRKGQHVHGISDMLALDDGSLLVMEREAYIPPKKIGTRCLIKIFWIHPQQPAQKHLLFQTRTRMNLLHQDFANYEGMCLGPVLSDGSRVLLLVADSQNQYHGILRDWFKACVIRMGVY